MKAVGRSSFKRIKQLILEKQAQASNGPNKEVEKAKNLSDGTNGVEHTAESAFRARREIGRNEYDDFIVRLQQHFLDLACQTGSDDYEAITYYIEQNKPRIISVLTSFAPPDEEHNQRVHLLSVIEKNLKYEDPTIKNKNKQILLDTVDKVETKLSYLEKLAALKAGGLDPELVSKLFHTIHESKTQGIINSAVTMLASTGSSLPVDEISGFVRHELASQADKDLVDNLTSAFNSVGYMQSYGFKGKLIQFLEVRRKIEKQDCGAEQFLEDIIGLQNHVYSDGTKIEGVDRVLNNALDNVYESSENIGGYYTEAKVALSFLDNGKKITHLSLNYEIDEYGKPKLSEGELIPLIDDCGIKRELDIVIDNDDFVEVKTTGHVLKNKNFISDFKPKPHSQAVGLAQIAIRKGVNYSVAIERGFNRDDVEQKIIDVRKLIKERSGIEVKILDPSGRDITSKFPLN